MLHILNAEAFTFYFFLPTLIQGYNDKFATTALDNSLPKIFSLFLMCLKLLIMKEQSKT